MNITITKHDIIVTVGMLKNRGYICTPKEAKTYLEADEGDVANAIISYMHDTDSNVTQNAKTEKTK